jgi:DNA-binding SARP family transcriptional activator
VTEHPPSRVRVELLGPLRLLVDGVAVEVRGPKRRAVLALLALAEGRLVTVDSSRRRPVAGEVPESGRAAMHSHVFRLRAHLGAAAGALETRTDGYRLALGGDALDLAQARALVKAARAGLAADPAGTLTVMQEAHALWRGPVLADLTEVLPIANAVEVCTQLYRDVCDLLVASAIAAGQAELAVDVAASSVVADPLREPAVVLLMRALAATGQAADALRTGREYRRRLAEETGLDPTPDLSEVEREIAGGAAGPPPAVDRQIRPATRLVGRDAQVAALHRLLAAERLVTLVGPGGVGKTRVALEVVRRSEVATVLLLAPVTDSGAIVHALAAALGLNVAQGDVLTACLAVLADGPRLLVIDNCEHLLDGVRDLVGVIVSTCPETTVLATSREPLGLAAEYTSRLAPLALPSVGQDATSGLAQVPSVAMFLDRASRVRAGAPLTPGELEKVADIVRRLDGVLSPSSSPRVGCRRSRCTTCTRGSTEPSTCSVVAAVSAATSDTGHCGRRSSGRTSCSARTSNACSGTYRSSSTASTLTPRTGSALTSAWPLIRAACWPRLVDASMLDRVLRGRHSLPHARDVTGVRTRPAGAARRAEVRRRSAGALGGRPDRLDRTGAGDRA